MQLFTVINWKKMLQKLMKTDYLHNKLNIGLHEHPTLTSTEDHILNQLLPVISILKL
jgi:hypothetical protein